MSDRRIGSILALARQGVRLDVEFGTRSLENLLRIAEVVEEAVYVPGSLEATPTGVGFSLANPPLRMGAFHALRLAVNGAPVPPSSARLRPDPNGPWRTFAEVHPGNPVFLRPGQTVEFAADVSPVPSGEVLVRLELENVAIPPLVWFEFREPVRTNAGPR